MANTQSPETALVVAHHRALQSWLNNSDEAGLRRFTEAHDPEFTLVDVEGARMDLARLDELLRSVGGKMPDLVIDISEVTVLAESGGLKLIRWEERHRGAGDATARIATAALRDDKWLSVHETWAGSGTVAP